MTKRQTALKEESVRVTENILRGPDGVYRWTYEMPMLKNPTILITVYKVLGISFGVVYLFMLILDLIQGVIRSLSELWATTWPFLILIGVFLVLGLLAYIIVAGSFGWKYVVHFEMGDTYIRHIASGAQAKKARALGAAAAVVGIMARRPTAAGAGLLGASKTESTTEYARVKTVKIRPRRHVVYLNETLEHNQIYAAPEDFGFVSSFLLERCMNAKVK